MTFDIKMGRQSASLFRPRPPGVKRLSFLVASVFALVLTACGQSLSNGENTIVIPPTPTRTSIPIATITKIQVQSTPLPTATLFAADNATKAVTSTKEPCTHSYFFEPKPANCPLDEPTISAAAEQPFEGGVMIWLEANDSVYVFYKDQRWQRFDDDWSEGQPENDPTIIPPEGLHQPIRGFGKVWREQADVRNELGWALSPELGYESKIQLQEIEEEAGEITFLLTFNGQVFTLVTREPNKGDWVIAAS